MQKLYYTIGEVAGMLGENVSLVRFWTDSFPSFVHPKRNAKGNRLYTEEDLESLRRIHFLVRECGMTLEGAARRMKNESARVDQAIRVADALKSIRSQLVEIRDDLK